MTDNISAQEIQDSQITILLPEWLLLNIVELAIRKGVTIDKMIERTLAESPALAKHLQKKRID